MQSPQQQQYAPVNIGAPDISGLIEQNYQTKQQAATAANGQLYSLVGNILGAGGRMAAARFGGGGGGGVD